MCIEGYEMRYGLNTGDVYARINGETVVIHRSSIASVVL